MRRNRASMRKERIIMLASSVFVLTALTMTGFYVKGRNEAEKDGYVVDMSALEKKTEEKTKELAGSVEESPAKIIGEVTENDLDYDPNFTEVTSGDVTNTWDYEKKEGSGKTAGSETTKETEAGNGETKDRKEETELSGEGAGKTQAFEKDGPEAEDLKEQKAETAQTEAGKTKAASASPKASAALSFHEKDNLAWPIAGNILINYSMDKTVYFPTLEQYKYNPAIVIAASEGENITASADGRVVSVFEDAEIGHAVKTDIGNGYELTYGQLQDISVMQGDIVSAGDIIGCIASPTKYYSKEGANLYFKLTRDGTPVDPMSRLE